MSWKPLFRLYASNGSTLVCTINNVIRVDGWDLGDNDIDYVELSNLRGKGSIIIPGGEKSHDITLYCYLGGGDYTTVVSAFDSIVSSIALNTHYVLKIDKSNIATDDINVMRLQKIQIDTSKGNLSKSAFFTLTLKANSW